LEIGLKFPIQAHNNMKYMQTVIEFSLNKHRLIVVAVVAHTKYSISNMTYISTPSSLSATPTKLFKTKLRSPMKPDLKTRDP